MIDENLRWLLSFYRVSEISGALFFGQLSRAMRAGPNQKDMTQHFADEAQHAAYWSQCLAQFGSEPLKIGRAYQDQYAAAAGMPVNMMEVLAITQVFERRVFNQYAKHSRVPNLQPEIVRTLDEIMVDEKWHLSWIGEALKSMEPEYGVDHIQVTLRRFRDADKEVYAKTTQEHQERVEALFGGGNK